MRNLPLLAALFAAAAAGDEAQVRIATLSWLSGCWESIGAEPGSGEVWLAPAGGAMLGIGRTVRNDRLVSWEYLRIVAEDDGIVLFVAPSRQNTTAFQLTRLGENEVVFENPAHDFPQKIAYRLSPQGGLIGRIEGTVDGAATYIEFPMIRTECGRYFSAEAGGLPQAAAAGTIHRH